MATLKFISLVLTHMMVILFWSVVAYSFLRALIEQSIKYYFVQKEAAFKRAIQDGVDLRLMNDSSIASKLQ